MTLALAATLVSVALWTGTVRDALAEQSLREVGLSHRDLLRLELWRVFTAALHTHGGVVFFLALAMLCGCVGWAERRFGAWRTLALFWASHGFGVLVLFLLFTAMERGLGHPWLATLQETYDVGPSAGYYGCLGAAIPFGWHRTKAVIAVVLLVRIAWSALDRDPSRLLADLAHALSYAFGVLVARRGSGSRAPSAAVP